MSDDLRILIADEISSIQVGSGYESTTIGITAALEAADALIAAGVVAEEPEWEYARRGIQPGVILAPDASYEEALKRVDLAGGNRYQEVVRRRKAGPWVPVKQEGAVQ